MKDSVSASSHHLGSALVLLCITGNRLSLALACSRDGWVLLVSRFSSAFGFQSRKFPLNVRVAEDAGQRITQNIKIK